MSCFYSIERDEGNSRESFEREMYKLDVQGIDIGNTFMFLFKNIQPNASIFDLGEKNHSTEFAVQIEKYVFLKTDSILEYDFFPETAHPEKLKWS